MGGSGSRVGSSTHRVSEGFLLYVYMCVCMHCTLYIHVRTVEDQGRGVIVK